MKVCTVDIINEKNKLNLYTSIQWNLLLIFLSVCSQYVCFYFDTSGHWKYKSITVYTIYRSTHLQFNILILLNFTRKNEWTICRLWSREISNHMKNKFTYHLSYLSDCFWCELSLHVNWFVNFIPIWHIA